MSIIFGPPVYPMGSIVITLIGPSILLSVYLYLDISKIPHTLTVFGVNKVTKKVTQPVFNKEILILGLRGIECQKFGFLDIFSETGH